MIVPFTLTIPQGEHCLLQYDYAVELEFYDHDDWGITGTYYIDIRSSDDIQAGIERYEAIEDQDILKLLAVTENRYKSQIETALMEYQWEMAS